MLGASQFVNVELFHFSGPYNYSSAQPLLCSLPRDSDTASFSSFRMRHPQVDFRDACGKDLRITSKCWGRSTNEEPQEQGGTL